MSKTIIVKNQSAHAQEFEVHGWNGNKNITVPAHKEHRISAPDGSSGAIIALHDGHEGEQAEITKKGFGGNDFFDVSVIVGAGGNMIAHQIGDNSTRKGDANFMQAMNEAWKKASQGTRDALKNVVHLKNGKVVRIDAPKNNKKLEDWVRTFADGKLYIGIGAWGNDQGNASDNNQSSAAHGNKDIVVYYSDEPIKLDSDDEKVTIASAAEPESVPVNGSMGIMTIQPQILMAAAAAPKDKGPGIELTNKSKKETSYYFYDNYWNGNGTAGANFDHPLKHVTLKPDNSIFVSLPASFKGRVQRGTQTPCTWVEFQLEASDDHGAHGDISLQQGCDGPATIASTDGSNVKNGFASPLDIVEKCPAGGIRKKPNGERAIDTTVGNWNGGPNKVAIEYLQKVVGQRKAYILGGTGVPDVASKNKRLAVVMY